LFEDLVNIYDDFTKNERTQSLARFADENGFEFNKREPFGEQATLLRNFKIFKKKGVKRFIGIVKIPSREGLDAAFRFYDYLVTKDLETTTTSIIEIFIPDSTFGRFRIKAKNGLSRMLSQTFSKSIEAKFKKRFSVESNIDIPLRIKELMLDRSKLTVEGFEDTMLFYHHNKPIELTEIFDYVEFAEDFVSMLESTDYEDFV